MFCANSLCCIHENFKCILVVPTVGSSVFIVKVWVWIEPSHCLYIRNHFCLLEEARRKCDFKNFPFFSYETKGQNLSVCHGTPSRSCARAGNDSCRQAAYCHSSVSFLQLMWQLNSRWLWLTWRVASRPAKLQGSSHPVSISLARALAPPLTGRWHETMLSVHVPTGPIITAHCPASHSPV